MTIKICEKGRRVQSDQYSCDSISGLCKYSEIFDLFVELTKICAKTTSISPPIPKLLFKQISEIPSQHFTQISFQIFH